MVAQLADDRFTTGWKDVDVATGCEAYVSGGVLTFQDNPKGLAVSGVAPVALPDSQLAPMQRWSPADWSSIEDRTGTKDVNTWGSGDPLTGNLVTSGRQAIYRIAAYLVSDPFTFTPQRIINVSISWQDLEGPRSALLISHPVSTNQKTITSAEKVILSAVGQPISYAITPDESGVEYRVYLRAEAV
jgi:hypothetical protein